MWRHGTITIPKEYGNKIYHYDMKVYETGSEYGINGGRISKLTLTLGDRTVANYDRGWDVEPDENEQDDWNAYLICMFSN